METREDQIQRETTLLRAVQCQADDISRLIVSTDLPWVDIAIRIEQFRAETLRLYPRKSGLFDLIYASRFRRLWQQWRRSDGPERAE